MCTLMKRAVSQLCTRAVRYNLKFPLSPHVIIANSRTFSISSIHLGIRKYTDKHEWISVDGNFGTVGVSHYAQDSLGDVVYVHVPEVGVFIEKDGEIGVIESVKAANEIYSPVSGTVSEVNELLSDKPSLVNESCYEKGWIYKIELADVKEMDALMEEDVYQKYVKTIHV